MRVEETLETDFTRAESKLSGVLVQGGTPHIGSLKQASANNYVGNPHRPVIAAR